MEKLSKKQDKNPFIVPEYYFDEVTGKIINATSGYEPEAKKVSLYGKIKPYLAVAAAISGFILISYTTLRLFSSNDPDNIVSEISLQELSDSYLNDIDLYTLEENGAAFLISYEIPDVNKSDIIDYLLRDNINIDEIYEQL